MSEINKTTTISGQYYSTASGPLDAKLTPADSYSKLVEAGRIPLTQRYVGLTVTVLNKEEGGIYADIDLEEMYDFRAKCQVIKDIKDSYEVIIK